MTPQERKQRINELYEEIRYLICECEHEFRPLTQAELDDEWMSVDARCIGCGESFGWRCKSSPDGVCDYDGSEYCIYCGMPEERK